MLLGVGGQEVDAFFLELQEVDVGAVSRGQDVYLAFDGDGY